ncbi:MAG TPA: flavin prenyltransferase UbiX [Gemmatimonadaceae bacterium]|jgi:4-hydroxy-3-polyprenylbenzoate decarboxylase|nr:flavin prenyltransferase UbiX [Gemmatimonadaceae bacterium]
MNDRPVVVAITGASGAPYAVRLIQALVAAQRSVQLIVSSHGLRLLQTESGVGSAKELRDLVGPANWDSWIRVFPDNDRGAPPASGSALNAGMVICPCSMGTLSAIAQGSSRSLIERAADVALKERRPLILVPRETPLSAIHLENMLKVTRAGAIVMPAAPGFYHQPTAIADLVDFIVARVMDHLGIPHQLAKRWSGEEPSE